MMVVILYLEQKEVAVIVVNEVRSDLMFKVNRTHNELIIYQTLAVIRRNSRKHRAKGSLGGGATRQL